MSLLMSQPMSLLSRPTSVRPTSILSRPTRLRPMSQPVTCTGSSSLLPSDNIFAERLRADPLFTFKLAVELILDCGSSTVAEYTKLGHDLFHVEFRHYQCNIIISIILDIFVMCIMAPTNTTNQNQNKNAIPETVFQPNTEHVTYSISSRVKSFMIKSLQCAFAAFVCGFVGCILNDCVSCITCKASPGVDVVNAFKTATTWALFAASSTNIRYQLLNGIETLVATHLPLVSQVIIVALRFINCAYGADSFVDFARLCRIR